MLLLVANGAGASVELRGADLSRLGAADESESTEASLRTPWYTVARQPASVKPRDARTGERNDLCYDPPSVRSCAGWKDGKDRTLGAATAQFRGLRLITSPSTG